MSATLTHDQTAYHAVHVPASGSVDADLFEAVRWYLQNDLGLDAARASARAQEEIERRIPRKTVDDLERAGVRVRGATVLDLGAGLGGMAEELLLRGASTIALEPGGAWADLATRRLARHELPFRMLRAFGEAIPLPDASVDAIVSWRVLEHVRDPYRVLAEAWRVLRPGGRFLLTCENYLAFREAHYDVAWLPLLPKPLGAAYLRLRGRSPVFLREAVTYTTYPQVLRDCRKIGFVRQRTDEIERALRTKDSPKWRALRAFARLTGGHGPHWLERLGRTFEFGVVELLRKPA